MHRQTPNSAKRSTKEDYNLQVNWQNSMVVRGHVSCSIFRARRAIPINEIILGRPLDKLIRRRGQIVMTLHHLAAEQKQVEQNTDWLDQAAYESRVNLLDGLSDWYAAEIGQVDKAIERIENHRYGFCVACHQAIEEARLETVPAAEFCSVCEELRAGCAAFELTRCTPEVTTALRIIGRRFVSAGASQRTSDPSYKSHEPLV